ncbi:MAG: class I mannose-6-phosphate isomerase [Victivallales bacterium]
MSFMFNPYPYEDNAPLNSPDLSDRTVESIVAGPRNIALHLADKIRDSLESGEKSCFILAMDGYAGAEWTQSVNLVAQTFSTFKIDTELIDVSSCYKSPDELDKMLEENLEEGRKKDPVLLFGKLFKGGHESLFNPVKLSLLKKRLLASRRRKTGKSAIIIYGFGSAFEGLRSLVDSIAYFDVTPKQAILRIKNGRFRNLGDIHARPFKTMMRRCYFYDFELALHLRAELIRKNLVDFYIASDTPDSMMLVPGNAFSDICASLVKYPFRCKPVYLEGVWGGHYISRLRNLPAEMKNCAWVFDLIPLEVSLLVKVGKHTLEIPFFAFVNKVEIPLMGRECTRAFHGYFPIRFNYDDSYHSSGNMSIQIHPDAKYAKENFNELGRQDESYYVVATGHGAKTYVGLRDGADAGEFIAAVKKSETAHTPVDYVKYVNYIDSKPGVQVMLPAGTVHSSGRNQVVLEIGSLTVGSYTFKLYDYLRKDLDGIPRPIHTCHGERVLRKERTGSWVRENIVRDPQLIRKGNGWAEYVIGESPLLYFGLYRYEFEKKIECDTKGVFHVLTLVDGEKVEISSKTNPERRYVQNYLDVVVVPADMGQYVIRNLGEQPVCIHKTCLKSNFTGAI